LPQSWAKLPYQKTFSKYINIYLMLVLVLILLTIAALVALVIGIDLQSRRPFDFKGKVVVLTGASSGIGEYLAYELSGKNCKLLLVARRIDLLKKVAARCIELGAKKVEILSADLIVQQENKAMIEFALKSFGTIDALILNAGRGSMKRFDDVTEQELVEYKKIMDLNYWSCVHSTFYALPHLKNSKGTIIVISSLAGKIGAPLRTGYSPTKHALHGFFNSLRTEVGNLVGITIICPGFVISEIHESALGSVDQGKAVVREKEAFMATDECARIIVKVSELGKREEVMTPIAKVGNLLQPLVPALIDNFAIKKVESVKLK